MKWLLKVILILLLIGIAVGVLAKMTDGFTDFSFSKNDKAGSFAFADKWELTAGVGDTALTINQDTKSIVLSDLSVKGKGGTVNSFKCNDTTFADKILVSYMSNSDVWNVGNLSSMTFNGNYDLKQYDFHGYTLYENPFSDYYNTNKSNLNIQSGAVVGVMQIDITFMFPDYIKVYDEIMGGNLSKLYEYQSISANYIKSVMIPIIFG